MLVAASRLHIMTQRACDYSHSVTKLHIIAVTLLFDVIIINHVTNYCISEVDRLIKRGGGCFYEERDNCQFFPDCPPSCVLVWISRDLEQSVTQPRETRTCILIAYTRRKHNVSETKHNFIVVVCFLLMLLLIV